MQASVHRFDPATGGGAVLTDDGLVLPFDADTFSASGLRHLRVGQRLSVGLDEAGRIRALRLGTVGTAPAPTSSP